jgi:hypothetical protein
VLFVPQKQPVFSSPNKSALPLNPVPVYEEHSSHLTYIFGKRE